LTANLIVDITIDLINKTLPVKIREIDRQSEDRRCTNMCTLTMFAFTSAFIRKRTETGG